VRIATNGGQTEFLNAYAAYDGLEEDTKILIDGLQAVHSRLTAGLTATPNPTDETLAEWRRAPTATQPLVWEHVDGRKSLMLGASVSHIEGMHPADSFDLINHLRAHVSRSEYIYTHHWRRNDLVIWNNTGTFHRARPYAADSGRLLHRFTLDGEERIRSPTIAARDRISRA
jgi:alpha-ketoglutarate-dependent taurine dioxygenase